VELSRDEVRKIAELAKLELSDDEADLYARQLTKILGYFSELKAVDTSQISATASVLPLKNVFRDDVPQPALSPEEVVKNASSALGSQFLVPTVLDE
jgi:aspartyl-tRNA(Asn)/glutamyl-tRNA(Gln) amidotransferase subunit C